jgi:hypothetical protein
VSPRQRRNRRIAAWIDRVNSRTNSRLWPGWHRPRSLVAQWPQASDYRASWVSATHNHARAGAPRTVREAGHRAGGHPAPKELDAGADLKIVIEKRPSPCFSIVRSQKRGRWVRPKIFSRRTAVVMGRPPPTRDAGPRRPEDTPRAKQVGC